MRVLIVENDTHTVELIKKAVGRLPHCSAAVYPDPASLTPSPDKIDFDLALIDSHARGSGLTLLAHLRRVAKHAQTPIVIMTGAADPRETRIDAFEAGATDIMRKPIEPVEFRVRLRTFSSSAKASSPSPIRRRRSRRRS